MKQYHLRKKFNRKDREGSSYTEYGDPLNFYAEIWPAGGRTQAEMYGEKLSYILNMLTEKTELSEGDGICVYTDNDPDYMIISVKRYSHHVLCELEKL